MYLLVHLHVFIYTYLRIEIFHDIWDISNNYKKYIKIKPLLKKINNRHHYKIRNNCTGYNGTCIGFTGNLKEPVCLYWQLVAFYWGLVKTNKS